MIPLKKAYTKINIKKEPRKGKVVPVKVEFENEDGDFKNVYNFVSSEIVKLKVKAFQTQQPTWSVKFAPTVNSAERFKGMSGAFTKEPVFKFRLEDENLIVVFGDDNTDNGSFVFQKGITKKIDSTNFWPANAFGSILLLDGEKTVSMSTDGMIKITVDSGLIVYDFMILAQSK